MKVKRKRKRKGSWASYYVSGKKREKTYSCDLVELANILIKNQPYKKTVINNVKSMELFLMARRLLLYDKRIKELQELVIISSNEISRLNTAIEKECLKKNRNKRVKK